MTDFEVAAILITLTAALAYINARLLRLPSAIGLMATALLGSIAVLVLDGLQVTEVAPRVAAILDQVNLPYALLHGMLGILLFAGALHVDLNDLREFQLPIAISRSSARRSRRRWWGSRATSSSRCSGFRSRSCIASCSEH